MQKLIFLCTALVLALAPSLAFAQDSVPWAADLETAKAAAAQQNRLVLLHFRADYCGPCRALEANVFTQPYFGSVVGQSFVPVKVDVEEHPEIASQYDISSIPCDVIITPQGEVRHHMASPQDAQQYLTILQQVARSTAGAGPQAVGGLYQQQPAPSTTAATPAGWGGGEATTGGYAGWQQPQTQPQQAPTATQAQPQGGYASQYTPAAEGGYGAATTPAATGGFQGYGAAAGASQYGGQSYGQPTTQPAQPAAQPTQPASTSQYGGGSAYAGGSQYGAATGGYAAPPATQPQVQVPTQPVAQQQPAATTSTGNPPLGLDGFCPVSLKLTRQWVQGDTRWGVIHRGRTYLFATAEKQQQFLADPDEYAPMISGNDPVEFVDNARLVPGERASGVFYSLESVGEHMYLFSSEENLQTFWNSPDRYARMVSEAMSRSATQR